MFAWGVVAAGGVNEDLCVDRAASVAIGEEPIERNFGNLRDGIPHCHVQDAYCAGTLAVAARFLVAHKRIPNARELEIVSGIIEQRSRVRSLQTRDKTSARKCAGRITAIAIQTETNHGLAVATHIGYH